MRHPRFVALLLCLATSTVAAQVRHCTTADGLDVYTDRRCEDLGATPAQVRPPSPPTGAAARTGCARTVRDLAFAMQTAIDQRDPNRLADSYLWGGQSTASGYAVLDRLATIAERPLADIVPVYAGGGDPALYPQEATNRTPVALRLEQTRGSSAAPATTVLALRRALGCWWVSF